MGYITELAVELGIAPWLLVVILVWTLIWKLMAMWKSAKNNHLVWFIVLALFNTVGILPILYIYVFSDLKDFKGKNLKKGKTKKSRKKPKKK
jgi:uncharacterized protein DUF5652